MKSISENDWLESQIRAFFSTTARRGRKSYAITSLIVWGVHFALAYIIAQIAANSLGASIAGGYSNPQDFVNFAGKIKFFNNVFFAFTAVFTVAYGFLSAQRLRDMNITGWAALLWIPIAFLLGENFLLASIIIIVILAVIPGTDGENKYGKDSDRL